MAILFNVRNEHFYCMWILAIMNTDGMKTTGAFEMIKQGQKITFKPEFQDAGDEAITFVAIEDEDGGRVKVRAELGLPINPVQVVRVDMIATAE